MSKAFNVLVLCTGNSARSLLGEALLNHFANGRWLAYSAGSQPKGVPHPLALATLQVHGISTAGLRSKSWDEFSTPASPALDVVITVCDNAANEVCPVWHGAPIRVHWGIPDPAAVIGSDAEQRAAFELAFQTLHKRIASLSLLPIAQLSHAQLQAELAALTKVY